MRTGLVAVGAAFAVVGAAVIVGVLYPGDHPSDVRTSLADVNGLSPGSWRQFVLSATPSHSATVTLNWTATTGNPSTLASVNVSLYTGGPCPASPGTCAVNPALYNWIGENGGHWTGSGAVVSSYVLYVDDPADQKVSDNFTATFVEQYVLGGLPLPMIPFAVTMLGGGLLAGVGAVALYLGVFLPSGVYDAPPEWDEADLDPIPPEPTVGSEPTPALGAAGREE